MEARASQDCGSRANQPQRNGQDHRKTGKAKMKAALIVSTFVALGVFGFSQPWLLAGVAVMVLTAPLYPVMAPSLLRYLNLGQ